MPEPFWFRMMTKTTMTKAVVGVEMAADGAAVTMISVEVIRKLVGNSAIATASHDGNSVKAIASLDASNSGAIGIRAASSGKAIGAHAANKNGATAAAEGVGIAEMMMTTMTMMNVAEDAHDDMSDAFTTSRNSRSGITSGTADRAIGEEITGIESS